MSNRKNRLGFTLVELLVVIGIIALLISILLPSLNKARQSAKSVACLSNLKQVGNAVQMYMLDSKGRLPWGLGFMDLTTTTSPTQTDWARELSRYLGQKQTDP